MTEGSPVYCGKCGTPNPVGNDFCRKCGHRLADDIVERPDPRGLEPGSPPASPVAGITIERYPLLDPETGEPLEAVAPEPAAPQRRETNPPGRRNLLLRVLAVHLASVCLIGVTSTIVLDQLGYMPSQDEFLNLQARFEELNGQREGGQINAEAFEAQVRELLDRSGFARLLLLLSAPMLFAFFIAGMIIGRLWHPDRLLEVGVAGFIIGIMCSICLMNFLVLPAAAGLSLLGVMLGRRWG